MRFIQTDVHTSLTSRLRGTIYHNRIQCLLNRNHLTIKST